MAAHIRPNRLDVTDRFPMLGFTIRTDSPPRLAEVVLATDPELFTAKAGRTSANFYTSREHGLLSLSRGEAVYVVRPDVVARFIHADRLYFGLATATPPAAADWQVDLIPTAQSPYVSLTGLSDRALRRVRMYPSRNGASYGANGSASVLQWAGDRAQPGTTPVAATPPPAPAVVTPAPSVEVPYDDGFGPLPPLRPAGVNPDATPTTGPAPAAQQGYDRSWSRTFEVDPDLMGIDEPVSDDDAVPQAMALGDRPRALTAAEYSGVTKIMPSPAYTDGRRGQAIDRIVIHITGAPQSRYLGSHFAREDADTSAHYLVDQHGDIIQFVREQDTAWHAKGANRRSIGIEHVAIQQGGARYEQRDGSVKTFPYTPPTDAEYQASAALVAHLCHTYALTPDRTAIIGHREADPGTTHTSCPDGAWDWDRYMALVAEKYAALPAAQAMSNALSPGVDPENMGVDEPACTAGPEPAIAAALDLTAADYDRVARIAPSPAFTAGRSGTAVDRIVIHITDAPTTSSTVNHFTRAGADSSAHYLVGQDGELVQFVSEADTAWHAKGVNRRSIGIEHVAVKQGGATYGRTTFPFQPPTDIQYSESAALVAQLCRKYGLTPDRSTIIGHREADPGTTHTSCPDGAWDWDHFMRLVTTGTSSAQPAAQALGLPAHARRRLHAVTMDAATISVSPDQRRITAPQVDRVSPLGSLAIEALLAVDPGLKALVATVRAAVEASGVSIGIGPQVSAGLLAGGGLGAGIIFAPGNVLGVYGQAELSAGLIASIGASVQMTIVNGGIDAFSGLSFAAAISGGEGLTGGAAVLFDDRLRFVGVTVQVGVGAGLSPLDLYLSVQAAVSRQLGLAAADGSAARAAALGAAGDLVEIKYRVFIPSPVIRGPLSDYNLGPIVSGEDFSGDGRTFSYDEGTSRAEITATVMLDADGVLSDLTTVDRHWGESKAYDSSYTYHVDRMPDWWRDRQAGLKPLRAATLPVTDDNLSISRGAPTLTRQIFAATSQSKVVSIHVAGALPLISGSPDIDADLSIYFRRGPGGGIEAMVIGDHDGFPCHELYLNRQQIYVHDPVATGDDPNSLLPPTDEKIEKGWISVPTMIPAGAQGLARTARALDAEDWSINWDDVVVVGQPTTCSCWATAAAMIDGWRRRQSVSVDGIAEFDHLSTRNGLPPASSARFAEAIGFTVHPNACYTPEGFRDVIEANGPVWVAAKVPGLHAIVVTGMYRKDGQYYVRITDPWDRVAGMPGAPGAYAAAPSTGSRYILTYDGFAAEFEAAGDTEFAQLLHTGGTHGHVINRGSATGAGYALAYGAGDAQLGAGTSLTRATSEKNGRRYDLAQLAGFVEPPNALAGGAGMPPLPGRRVVLDDWPYIDGPGGRTQAGVGIDWHYRNGAVGEIAISPLDGQVLDGWTALVRADITPGTSTSDHAALTVRVTTTFSLPGEEDQTGVTQVVLSGDGRQSTVHGADRAPEPATTGRGAADGSAATQPVLVTA